MLYNGVKTTINTKQIIMSGGNFTTHVVFAIITHKQ